MNYNAFIGIDVSKLTFDVFIHEKSFKQQFTNSEKGFMSFVKWLKEVLAGVELSQVLVCFEHTGLYSLNLAFKRLLTHHPIRVKIPAITI